MSRRLIRSSALVGDAAIVALLGKAAWKITLTESDLAMAAGVIALIGLNVAAILLTPPRRTSLRL
jgi:hypothetical protein